MRNRQQRTPAGNDRGEEDAMVADAPGPKEATPTTCAHNRSFLDMLPFGDRADFEDAARGFIATLPKVEFRNADGFERGSCNRPRRGKICKTLARCQTRRV
jgi:hypothetical protein